MSESSFNDKLRAHYSGQCLSEERLALLTALATAPPAPVTASPSMATPNMTKPRRLFATVGFSRAAALLLLIVSGGLAVQWGVAHRDVSTLRDRVAELEQRGQVLESELSETRLALQIGKHGGVAPDHENARYVAVRIASATCPHCARTAPLFEKLVERHAKDDVLFVSMDVTTPAERCQSEKRACELDLDWAEHDCQHCCMIRVFDRKTRQLVATQVATAAPDEFEHRFDELLKKPGG